MDLLLPAVGGSARKTNYDYTKGQLGELIDVIIAEGTKLFVSAVGVPPPAQARQIHLEHAALTLVAVAHVWRYAGASRQG